MEQSPHRASRNNQPKRLVVGWFSFTCCEDSTILFTELLIDHLDEWKKVIEFRVVGLGRAELNDEGMRDERFERVVAG